MRYCLHCGMPLEDDDRFCVRCGKPVAAAADVLQEDLPENGPEHMEPESRKKKQGSLAPVEERETAPEAESVPEMKAAPKTAAGPKTGGTASSSRPGRSKMGYGSSRAVREQEAQRKMAIILFLVCLILAGTLLVLLLRPGRSTSEPDPGAAVAAGAPAAEAEAVPADDSEEEEARLEAERQAEAERKAAEEAQKEAEQKAAEEEAARKAAEEAEQKAAEEAAAKKAAEEEAARKAAEEEAARKAAAADGSYILADSSTRTYSYEELNRLDDYSLQMAINEIYARHGRKFDTPEIQEYFNKKSWYKGTIAPKDFDGNESSYFNNHEKSNRELMARIRDERAAAAQNASGENEEGTSESRQ